jgi:hypothetical protein
MLLWDYEMERYRKDLARMSSPQRLALTLRVIEWTLASLGSALTDHFSPRTARFVDTSLDLMRCAVAEGHADPGWPEDFEAEAHRVLDDEEDNPGAESLIMAIVTCLSDPDEPSDFTAGGAHTAMSSCYEAILNREDLADTTIEGERASARCRHAIEVQQGLITSIANS